MKKSIIFLLFFTLFGVSSTFAQSEAPQENVDGLFGNYFLRMVKPCEATEVVTGFLASPFGKIICKDIREVLNKIPTTDQVSIGNVPPTQGSKLTVDGVISAQHPTDDSPDNVVVTKKYLEEFVKKRVPRIEIGTFAGGAGRVRINFKKRFDVKPIVIAMPVWYSYTNNCRFDWVAWNTTVSAHEVDETGFWVEMRKKSECGGSMHNYAISYVAMSNIENLTSVSGIAPVITPPNNTEDASEMDAIKQKLTKLEKEIEEFRKNENNSNMGRYKFFVPITPCRSGSRYKKPKLFLSTACNYKMMNGGNVMSWYSWFDEIDDVILLSSNNVAEQVLQPIVTHANKVILTVTQHEYHDWPAIGTQWTFCDDSSECLAFGEEHYVWNHPSNNHLYLTVTKEANGVVKLRYRAMDWSHNYGWVQLRAEVFY